MLVRIIEETLEKQISPHGHSGLYFSDLHSVF